LILPSSYPSPASFLEAILVEEVVAVVVAAEDVVLPVAAEDSVEAVVLPVAAEVSPPVEVEAAELSGVVCEVVLVEGLEAEDDSDQIFYTLNIQQKITYKRNVHSS
jgi:hypothetical protein